MAEIITPTPKSQSIPTVPTTDRRFWPLAGIIPPLGLAIGIWLWLAKGLRRVAALTVLVSLVFLGLYLYIYSAVNNSNQVVHYPYSYGKTQASKYNGQKAGTSATFQTPQRFTLVSGSKKPYQTYQLTLADGAQTVRDTLSVASVPVIQQTIDIYLPQDKAGISSAPGSSQYQTATGPITSFVKKLLPADYQKNAHLSQPKVFMNPNIRQNAWQFDITSPNSSNPQLPPLHGTAVYAWGSKAVYYFVISAVGTDWSSSHNLQMWQSILKSLALDQ
jgi:hypothetical protein